MPHLHMGYVEKRGPSMQEIMASDRPRERLTQLGPQALSTIELLSIIVRNGTQEENALNLATRILASFDGLPGIAQASITELTNIPGIGSVKAVSIKAALELGRRLAISPQPERPLIQSPADAANLLMADMSLLDQQELRTIIMDTRNRVLATQTIYQGHYSSVIRQAEVFRDAIRINAAAILVAHNRPDGDTNPSPKDVEITRELVKAGDLLDIPVMDHLIIGRQRWVSLRERGLGFG